MYYIFYSAIETLNRYCSILSFIQSCPLENTTVNVFNQNDLKQLWMKIKINAKKITFWAFKSGAKWLQQIILSLSKYKLKQIATVQSTV